MNLVGKSVGRLTVVSKAKKIGGRCAWLCKCQCGNEKTVLQQSLVKYAPTSSCGCLRAESLTKDLVNLTFGFWQVKSQSSRKKKPNGGVYWLCVCDCGHEKEIAAESLLCGKSVSCGCSKNRPVCPYGHVILEWGRDKTGMCRACIKNRNLLREYGITLDEYLQLWKYQDGKCAICGLELSIKLGRSGWDNGCRAELDHEHNNELEKKKQVRGLLCGGRWSGCNRKLGRLDKVVWLLAAAEYVENPPARKMFSESLGEEKANGIEKRTESSSEEKANGIEKRKQTLIDVKSCLECCIYGSIYDSAIC
jgi:hypothetical protein